MNLLKSILKDELFIDFGSEILYGSDQMYMDYPVRFATVTFKLMETELLSRIADRIRLDKHEGLLPMHPMDEYTEETCDQGGWYDLFLEINDFDESKVNSYIEVIVVSSDAPDNEELYTIDLDEHEQECVYARLDEQCRQYLGKSCAELLAEARKRMEDDYA